MLSLLSCVWFIVTLWTITRQAPLSMVFSRREYWSWFPCPLGDLPFPGTEPMSLKSPALAGRFFITSAAWEALLRIYPPPNSLRVPWTARRSNQSILKEISPGCSLEGLILKLKLQCFGHLMRRVDSLEKTQMLGGIGGRSRRGWQRMR